MQTSLTSKNRYLPISFNSQQGLSLVELMVAITIGLLLIAGMATLLVNMSSASREQFKAAQQIENGRFATDLLENDIRLAGYYGEFSDLPAITSFASQPDPCAIPAEENITTTTTDSALAFYIQGYHAANLTTAASVPAQCQAWIDNASIKAGSDIIVVKRLETVTLIDPPTTTSAIPVSGQVYGQATSATLGVQYGAGVSIDTTKTANNVLASSIPLLRKDYTQATSGTPAVRPTIAAYVRKLVVHVYFVSPCRAGSGTNGNCTGADDTIPTLKRLELTASGGAATMTLVPLVEGIEFLKFNYGLDNVSPVDGTVDTTVTLPTTIADWQNIVQVEIRLIARNSEPTNDKNDDLKTYDLGNGDTFTPSGAELKYRRHAFNQKIYLPNIGGKRES